MEFDLKQLFRMLRHWWWLALAMPFAFAALAFVYTNRQLPKYSSTATMIVTPSSTGSNEYNALLTAERLSATYQRLAKNATVLQHVVDEMKLAFGPGTLSGMITISTVKETQLLLITVIDTNPNRAAAIANTTANQFQAYVVSELADSTESDVVTLNDVIAGMKTEIDEANAEIATLQASENPADPVIVAQIQALTSRLDAMQGTYGGLLSQAAILKTSAAAGGSPIKLAVPASVPGAPFAPSKPVNVMLGLFAGAILAAGIIMLLEYLDNTVKSTSDLPSLVGTPLLATVGSISRMVPGSHQLFVLEHPKGGAAESIRLLRTNIEFASATKEIAVFGITSANSGEGKSTIASNLAVALAQAGFVTALVDADLRRPTIHQVFGLSNDRGLSTVLSGPNRAWDSVSQSTDLPNLSIISAGPLPPNPADLLSLERMGTMVREMRRAFDVIILDTPPVLAVSDPLIVAQYTDGMIVVSRSGKTRIDTLKRATGTLQRGGVRIIGTIVNKERKSTGEGYYVNDYIEKDSDSPKGDSERSQRPEASTLSAAGRRSAS